MEAALLRHIVEAVMTRGGGGGDGVSVLMSSLMVVYTTISFLPLLVTASDFKGPPRVEPVEPFVLLSVGDNYKLTCPIKGSPSPMYEWFKDDEDITFWTRYNTKNSHLRLKDVQGNDSGRFKCLAINGFGQANFTFNVVVVEEELPPNRQLLPPVLTVVEPPSPVVVPEGEQVILECEAEGFPAPEIHWSKDGLSLKHSGPTLPLSAPRPGEGGLFSCTARNPLGSASSNFSVSVRAPERKIPKGGSEDGLVVAGAFNTTVMQGGNTTLQCTVTTDTRPEISWLREVSFEIATNKNNTLELQNRRFIVIKSTTSPPSPRGGVHSTTFSAEQGSEAYLFNLNIQGARRKDQGLYACLGVNPRGYSYREAYLTVLPGHSQADVWDGGVASEAKDSHSFLIYLSAGAVVIVIMTTFIICRVRKRNFLRSTTTTTTTIASPPPKYEDPSSLTPLHPDKQKGGLPGLQPPPPQPQHGSSIKRGSRHNTIHSYNSTLPLPPPTLPPDLVYQHDGLVYPPGKSRPLPHGPSPGGLYSSDHYVYPTETSYLEPGYSDPYMERHSENSATDSSLDLNYSEAMHSPHPNTPIPVPQHQVHPYHPHHHTNLHPPVSNGVPGGGTHPHLTPNLPRHQQQLMLRNNKSDLNVQTTESSNNSKRSDSRTTTSNTNSPRDLSRSTAEQYYNSVSNSSCGGDDYSSPVIQQQQQQQQQQKSYNSYLGNNYHPNISSSSNNSNNNKNTSNNLTSRSSEHSYARLIPTTASPAPSPPYGITFPNSGGQSQYVVHYNL